MTYRFTTIPTVALSRRPLAIIGSTISFVSGSAGLPGLNVNPTQTIQNNTWWCQALTHMGWPYELVACSMASGRTTAQAYTAFATEVTPYNPQEVWIALGEADMTSASTATSALASMDQIIAACVAINPNIIIRIATVLPGDATSNTTAYRQAMTTFNYGLARRAQYDPNVQVIDMGAVVRDPTSTTGQAIANYLSSSDHVTPVTPAYNYLGAYWANDVGLYNPPVSMDRPFGNYDYYASNANANRILPNPCFSTSGGAGTALGTGVSGTIPTSWVVDGGGNSVLIACTVTQDTVSSTVFYPKSWLNLTYSGTSTGVSTSFIIIDPAAPAIVTPGTTKMRARCEFKTASLLNIEGISMYTEGTNGATQLLLQSIAYPDFTLQTTWPTTFSIECPAIVIPSGTTTFEWGIIVNVRSGVTVSGSLSISQPIWEVVV